MQDMRDVALGDARPDPVAQQQVAFAFLQLAVEVVHHQVLIQPQGTLEDMLHARLFPDVVFAESLQFGAVPAIGAAVADMRQGEASAAQYQRRERGQQRLVAAVGLQPAVVRHQHTVQRLCDGPGFRRRVVVEGQRLQGRAGRQPAIGALADAVGQCEQIALAGGQRRGRRDDAQRILVFRPRAGGAGLAVTQSQGHDRSRKARYGGAAIIAPCGIGIRPARR